MLVRGMIRFNTGMLRLPIAVQAWVMLLAASNFVVPLFYLGRSEAWLILGFMAVNAALMFLIAGGVGFVRLMGLGHFSWLVLLPILLLRLDGIPAADLYGWWIRVTVAINAISLVFDVVDVVRYVKGERGELVALSRKT